MDIARPPRGERVAPPAPAASLLVAGTTSDAGKSIVTTALCRAYARRGLRVAPFKAQNMSNNSMVVAGPAGSASVGTAEIGRAQWIQALAARAVPEPAMNPVLLKPGGDRRSHVVVMGQPAGSVSSRDFVDGRTHLAQAAFAAYDDLASRYDLLICEGAGSPAEINLRSSDYVNMGLARHADMPVVVVGDIDRGGVFAALFGTVALLEPADQRLVAGFVVNKFRGDPSLLAPGLDQLTALTGRPVHGVLPWDPDLWLDSEDALAVSPRAADATTALRVAVIRLPRISNFTDVDALGLEADVEVAYVTEPRDLAGADLVVVPGTRATLDDLAWLRARGLDRALTTHVERGGAVLGICGGFQMLGGEIADPDGIEGSPGARVAGLGLLDVTTRFGAEKVLRLPTGTALGQPVSGYEIHHGRVTVGGGVGGGDDDGEEFPGGARRGRVFGTMWHGTLESDGFRSALLAEVARGSGGVGGVDGGATGGSRDAGHERPASSVSFARAREARLDLLGDLAEKYLDLDALLELARSGPPPLPILPPGADR